MKRVWKQRWAVVTLVVALVGAVTACAWPRGPRLVWYDSPRILLGDGGVTGVRLRVPPGWGLRSLTRLGKGNKKTVLVIGPPPRKAGVIRSSLTPPQVSAKLIVTIGEVGEREDTVSARRVDTASGRPYWVASNRNMLNEGLKLDYVSEDHESFEASYRQICEHFCVRPLNFYKGP